MSASKLITTGYRRFAAARLLLFSAAMVFPPALFRLRFASYIFMPYEDAFSLFVDTFLFFSVPCLSAGISFVMPAARFSYFC